MVTTALLYIRALILAAAAAVARQLARWFLGPDVITAQPSGHKFILDRRRWRLIPVMAGGAGDDDEDDADEDDEKDDDVDKDKKDDDDKSDEDDDEDEDKKDEPDWKRESRKHERDKKKAQRERDELKRKLQEREDEKKSETQKKIDAAREEGRTAALTESQKERRADRLEMASLKLATGGVKIGEGDKAVKHKFADPEDAEAHLQRAINRGDVDEDDLFDDNGRINKDALAEALAEILDSKPHLRATSKKDEDDDEEKGRRRTADGGADGGKGGRGGAKDLEEMSPDDHLKEIQRR